MKTARTQWVEPAVDQIARAPRHHHQQPPDGDPRHREGTVLAERAVWRTTSTAPSPNDRTTAPPTLSGPSGRGR